MSLLDSSDPRPIHFVGAAGAGMSALAELFARRGARVTGCDAAGGSPDLDRLGVPVHTGHDAAHADASRALIVTSAMPHDHPELARGRALGIPVIRRAEALAEAVSGSYVIGIAGTHGKTTTTVMTTEALAAAGLNPTGVAGGRVGAWQGNLSAGGDALFVVEADEYDRSFLALSCEIAVITNVEADHLDIYRDLNEIRAAFAEFASHAVTLHPVRRRCRRERRARRDRGAGDPLRHCESGCAPRRARRTPGERWDARSTPVFDGKVLPVVTLQVPGVHNVLNALAALASGLALGADAARLAAGLGNFTGVERRFQRLGDGARRDDRG